MAASEEAVEAAERAREDAQTRFTTAVRRVEQAKRWAGLDFKRAELERQLAAAEQRAADAATIQARRPGWTTSPARSRNWKSLVDLRDRIADLERRIATAGAARDGFVAASGLVARAADSARAEDERHRGLAVECDQRAKDLGEEIGRGSKFLELADALEQVRIKLSAYPDDLEAQVRERSRTRRPDAAKCKRLRTLTPPPPLYCGTRSSSESGSPTSRLVRRVPNAGNASTRSTPGRSVPGSSRRSMTERTRSSGQGPRSPQPSRPSPLRAMQGWACRRTRRSSTASRPNSSRLAPISCSWAPSRTRQSFEHGFPRFKPRRTVP